MTLSGGSLEDVLLLGKAYHASSQYRRALCLLRQHGVIDAGAGVRAPRRAAADSRVTLLAASCMLEVGQLEARWQPP